MVDPVTAPSVAEIVATPSNHEVGGLQLTTPVADTVATPVGTLVQLAKVVRFWVGARHVTETVPWTGPVGVVTTAEICTGA